MSQFTNGPTSGSLDDTGLSNTYPTSATGTLGTTGSPNGADASGSRTEAAKEAGRETAHVAQGEAKHVAETAKEELGNVTSTATDQMRRLMDQSRSELTDQARSQQQRLTTNLRSLTDELDSMVGAGQPGVAHDLVRQVSQQARTLGDWLDGNEPGAVLDEVKRFARRKPGTFLAVAAGLGFLSGRMTRGLSAASQEDGATAPGAYASTGTAEPVLDGPLATTGATAMSSTAPTGAADPLAGTDGWLDRGDAR